MRVLSIAVHPDDETLGCGGTLLKHAAAGDSIHWLLLTAATAPQYSDEAILRQRQQVDAAAAAYKFASVDWLKLPTTRLDSMALDDIIAPLRDVLVRVRPEVVYLPNRSDAHSDHRVAFQAASAVVKPPYMRDLGVRQILMCETLSETDAAVPFAESAFLPNHFVDVSIELHKKLDIMALYRSELQGGFLPRALSSMKLSPACAAPPSASSSPRPSCSSAESSSQPG